MTTTVSPTRIVTVQAVQGKSPLHRTIGAFVLVEHAVERYVFIEYRSSSIASELSAAVLYSVLFGNDVFTGNSRCADGCEVLNNECPYEWSSYAQPAWIVKVSLLDGGPANEFLSGQRQRHITLIPQLQRRFCHRQSGCAGYRP